MPGEMPATRPSLLSRDLRGLCCTRSGNSGVHTAPARELREEVSAVMGVILVLLLLWLVLVVVGFVVKTLFWLAIIGIALFVATGIFGAIRGGRSRRGALR